MTEVGEEEESMIRLSRVGYDGTIGYLEGGFDSWKKSSKDIDYISRITSEEFETKSYRKVPVIHVRKKSEYDSEHIIGAENIPLNEINNHLSEIPKEGPFVLHCAGGYRSMIAASILKSRGWSNFFDVTTGFAGLSNTSIPRSEYVCLTTLLKLLLLTRYIESIITRPTLIKK